MYCDGDINYFTLLWQKKITLFPRYCELDCESLLLFVLFLFLFFFFLFLYSVQNIELLYDTTCDHEHESKP